MIRATYWNNSVAILLEEGDVVVVDNMLAAHGTTPTPPSLARSDRLDDAMRDRAQVGWGGCLATLAKSSSPTSPTPPGEEELALAAFQRDSSAQAITLSSANISWSEVLIMICGPGAIFNCCTEMTCAHWGGPCSIICFHLSDFLLDPAYFIVRNHGTVAVGGHK